MNVRGGQGNNALAIIIRIRERSVPIWDRVSAPIMKSGERRRAARECEDAVMAGARSAGQTEHKGLARMGGSSV